MQQADTLAVRLDLFSAALVVGFVLFGRGLLDCSVVVVGLVTKLYLICLPMLHLLRRWLLADVQVFVLRCESIL